MGDGCYGIVLYLVYFLITFFFLFYLSVVFNVLLLHRFNLFFPPEAILETF